MPILFLLLGLIVLAGFIVILVLILKPMRQRITVNPTNCPKKDTLTVDPWKEAARRIEVDDPHFDELA